jgi:hypothetical protein
MRLSLKRRKSRPKRLRKMSNKLMSRKRHLKMAGMDNHLINEFNGPSNEFNGSFPNVPTHKPLIHLPRAPTSRIHLPRDPTSRIYLPRAPTHTPLIHLPRAPTHTPLIHLPRAPTHTRVETSNLTNPSISSILKFNNITDDTIVNMRLYNITHQSNRKIYHGRILSKGQERQNINIEMPTDLTGTATINGRMVVLHRILR